MASIHSTPFLSCSLAPRTAKEQKTKKLTLIPLKGNNVSLYALGHKFMNLLIIIHAVGSGVKSFSNFIETSTIKEKE